MLGKQRKAIEALAQTLSDMATRSHTTLFKDLRERAKQHRALHPTVEEEVIPLDVVDEHGNVIQAPPKEESALDYDGAPPEFLERTKPIGINLQKLKTKMDDLAKRHAQTLLANFGSNEQEQRAVEILTSEITSLFRETKTEIKTFGAGFQLNPDQLKMRDNIQSLLAGKLSDLSMIFRKQQKDYLEKLKRNTQTRAKLPTIQAEGEDDDDDGSVYDTGFNADQMNAVAMSNRQIQQREREIRQIAKSVNELAEIFRDMAELVHEQGSILDRIDYNLEQTKEHMVEAKKELKGAASYADSARNKYCILLLIILVVGAIAAILVYVSS